jgi:hypothetical protein
MSLHLYSQPVFRRQQQQAHEANYFEALQGHLQDVNYCLQMR